MKVFDLLLDADLDLDVRGGDLAIGESTEQHQQLILLTEQGEWRQSPFVGAGIRTMILDESPAGEIIQEVQSQLEADGQVISELTISTEGKLYLLASYSDQP
jgi:hypothetical protein